MRIKTITDEDIILSDEFLKEVQSTIGYNVIAIPLKLYPRFVLNIGNINRDVYNWEYKNESFILMVIKNKVNLPAMKSFHKDLLAVLGDNVDDYFGNPKRFFTGLNNISNYSTYKISFKKLMRIIDDYKLDYTLLKDYENLFYKDNFTEIEVKSNIIKGSIKEVEKQLNELYGIKKGE